MGFSNINQLSLGTPIYGNFHSFDGNEGPFPHKHKEVASNPGRKKSRTFAKRNAWSGQGSEKNSDFNDSDLSSPEKKVKAWDPKNNVKGPEGFWRRNEPKSKAKRVPTVFFTTMWMSGRP